MAKRFTSTEKWNKRFIRSLHPTYKLFWLYLLDECDTAGIWDVDIQVAEIKIGVKLSEAEALKLFYEKVIPIDFGSKWFIPSFIEFQYGELLETNRAHTKAISQLKKFDLLTEDFKIKPLTSPLQGAMVEEEVKEKVEVKDKEKEKPPKPKTTDSIVMPFDTPSFMEAWDLWLKYKQQLKDKYTSIGEQGALKKLSELANGNVQIAIAIIHQSIANNWKGLFQLKDDNNGNRTNQNSAGNGTKSTLRENLSDLARNF